MSILKILLNYEPFKQRNLRVVFSIGGAYFTISERKSDPNKLTENISANDNQKNTVESNKLGENNLEEPMLSDLEDHGQKKEVFGTTNVACKNSKKS